MKIRIVLFLIVSCLTTAVSAQQMGQVQDYSIDRYSVTINSATGKVIVQQYANCGWKVTTLPSGMDMADERESITLTGAQRGKIPMTVTDKADRLEITAGISSVTVDKRTSLLSFSDNDVVRLREKTCIDNAADSITITFEPQNDNAFYGGGYNGRWGNLDGRTLRMNNSQMLGWDQTIDRPNNICVPFVVSSNGYGVLFEDHYIDAVIKPSATEGLSYGTKSPTPISYVYVGSEDGTPAGVMRTYAALTGTHELPPYWSLGYITSRYGYHTQQETEDVIASFEKADMPVSGVVLDLFWEGEKANGMGNLDWYRPNWPDAIGMMNRFKEKGIHTVIITEPYFAEETGNYRQLSDLGLFADPDCPNMTWVSDNKVGIIDFMNPASVDWYWNFYRDRTDEGVDGWWLDLGEPEMISEGTIHADGSTHLQAHNEFGQKWIEGVWAKWKQQYPDKRPFFMPRSGTSGMHRYATFPWTGDIQRSWSGLKCQVPAMINGGMSGLGYLSSDIGGFNTETKESSERIVNPELYLRWFQMGVFTPVLRTHSQYLPEPYQPVYDDYRDLLKGCITMRYQLLPYIYSAAWSNSTAGIPITAPLNLYTAESKAVADLDDEYLFGPNILVAPISEPGMTGRDIVLPSGEWVDMATMESYQGNRTISFTADDLRMPVFLRCGTFTPLYTQDEFDATESIDRSMLTILYPLSETDSWDFVLYDDDHESAQVGDRYELITFSGKNSDDSHIITISQQCTENYEGRPDLRMIDFIVRLRYGQTVSSISSDNLSITDIESDKAGYVLKFRASVPSQNGSQNTISICFRKTDTDNVKTGNTSRKIRKYLTDDNQISIESNGHTYDVNGIY